jgi:hypothetical protein
MELHRNSFLTTFADRTSCCVIVVVCVCVCDSLSLSLQVQRKVGLVYGGGSIGLMGKIAGTVHTGGGTVTGYVPLRQSLRRFNLAS